MRFWLRSLFLSPILFLLGTTLSSAVLAADHITTLRNPKKDWVKYFNAWRQTAGLETFIESGTYLGATTALAGRCFSAVYTIELNAEFYRKATEKLKNFPQVKIYQNDSSVVFRQLLPAVCCSNILFWLDGHFMSCMEEADGSIPTGAAYTPIMAELQAIIAAQVNNSVILIDDIRLFGSALNGRRVPAAGSEHYPLFSEVCALLTANGFTCVVLGDILLAHNVQRPLNFSAVVTACTVSRLYDGANYSDVTILAQEQVIAAAQGEELATLKEAYTNHSMLWRAWRNRSPYFNLWYGLSLQNSGQHRQAAVEFQEVIRLGYEHWRIFWYLAQSYHAVNDQSQTQAALQRVLSINPMFKPAQQLLTLVTRAG